MSDKVIVVTGGSGEMGCQVSYDLAKNDFVVVFTYNNNNEKAKEIETLIKSFSPKSFCYKVDVSNSGDVMTFASILEDKFNCIYGLVNCAGISPSSDLLVDITEEMWDKILNVNLKGTFLMCKYILPLIIRGGQGRVINISSIHGKNPPSMRTAYGASKFGVIGLSQALSKEVAKHSICVNTICPGPVKSDMLDNIWKRTASKSGITFEEFKKKKLSEIPLGKLCEPKDISGTVLFLLSESAKHITGSTVDINGGAV